jgi:V/A-type H+-transporting ATPase subunit K
LKRVLLMLGLLTVAVLATGSVALAQAPAAEGPKQLTIAHGLLAIAMAISISFGAIGTAWAQSRIGAAAAGAIAERPEISGQMLIFLVLPETLIIFGFLGAFLIWLKF